MVNNTKWGSHITTGPRDGYGLVAPHQKICAGFLADAFVECSPDTITVWRPGTQNGIYVYDGQGEEDIFPGFPQQPLENMALQAGYWWPKMLAAKQKEEARLQELRPGLTIDYIQPTNETGGDSLEACLKLIAYERALMDLADRDGVKLAIGNNATNAPHWGQGIWQAHYAPFIIEAWQRGHAYSRHVYFDFDADSVPRVGWEVEYLRTLGPTGPILLTEAGFINFPGVNEFIAAVADFDVRMSTYPEIVGMAAFTYGNWTQRVNANIEKASAEFAAYLTERPFLPGVYEYKPEITETLYDQLFRLAEEKRAMTLNKDAAIQAAIFADTSADGAVWVPFSSEFWFWRDGIQYAAQGARDIGSEELRVYFAEVPNWHEIFSFSSYENWPIPDPDPLPDTFAPTHWPTAHRHVNQFFGANPQNYAEFDLPGHDGTDIRAYHGDPIYAVAPGIVYRVEKSPSAHNYGVHVRIQHADGYKTIYGHMLETRVEVGQSVTGGHLLGLADNTGNSFGSHLHFGAKRAPGDPGWPFDLTDSDAILAQIAPELFPDEPTGDEIDLLSFMLADEHVWRVVRHPDGSQEDFRDYKYIGEAHWAMVKNQAETWRSEHWYWDDTYIYLKRDYTPEPAPSDGTRRFYVVTPGRWARRFMQEGQSFNDGGHTVQFFDLATGQPHPDNSGLNTNITTVASLHRNYPFNTYGQNLILDEVLFIQGNTEKQIFGKHAGLSLGRVGWASPWGRSEIVELHTDRGYIEIPPAMPWANQPSTVRQIWNILRGRA